MSVDMIAARTVGRAVLGVTVGAGLFIAGNLAGFGDATERIEVRNAAIMDVVAGDYGPARTELDFDEVGALLPVYGASEDGQPCYTATAVLVATRDYEGWMAPCLGEEDSDAVRVILRGGRQRGSVHGM